MACMFFLAFNLLLLWRYTKPINAASEVSPLSPPSPTRKRCCPSLSQSTLATGADCWSCRRTSLRNTSHWAPGTSPWSSTADWRLNPPCHRWSRTSRWSAARSRPRTLRSPWLRWWRRFRGPFVAGRSWFGWRQRYRSRRRGGWGRRSCGDSTFVL